MSAAVAALSEDEARAIHRKQVVLLPSFRAPWATCENPRWSLICCYNTRRNNPYKEIPGGHPSYSYLERWPDERVKEMARRQLAQMEKETHAVGAR